MSENELLKKQRNGFYRDVEIAPSQMDDDQIESKYQEIEGVSPSADKDYQFNILEMHVDLDLEEYAIEDAPKNVKVPYIVTIDEGSSQILSIYRNYQPFDETYKRKEYFVHFKFLPGLGFYGFGLIHMIGGLSKTATAALRQLLDAGTLSNLPAGFKSRVLELGMKTSHFNLVSSEMLTHLVEISKTSFNFYHLKVLMLHYLVYYSIA